MTRDQLAALDRAATQGVWDEHETGLISGGTQGNDEVAAYCGCDDRRLIVALVNAYRTGKLVLIDDGAVEAVPKPTRAQMEYKWKRRAEESEARATAAEAREARLLEALRKIEAGEGIGGPDAELQCADIALAAIEENQRGQG